MMTDESQGRGNHSPTPDSISETIDNEAVPGTVSVTERHNVSSDMGYIDDLSKPSTSAMADYAPSNKKKQSSSETVGRDRAAAVAPCAVPLCLSLNSDIQLPGSSSSAFRPFVSEPIVVSPEDTRKSPTQSQQHLISTPTSRRQTIPGSTVTILGSQASSPNPDNSGIDGESSNTNDDYDDGRTTASAPPCTPAPEPHIQVQSPFRNSRPIKRIDLLAMSRSRQSDRAENARRDGRLAPSPRKKDEVLRNSGYLCPANRSYGYQPSMRSTNTEGFISPERVSNGASSAASPNVDVVSVDDPNDASKYKFSIQFHNIEQAEQMMKCNLCGFVTNNQRFYRRHRRLHNRQHPPNQIQCSQCDYSTTQIRRMREHTMTHQNLPSQPASANPHFRSSNLAESTQNPHFQGHFFIPSDTVYPPNTRPITLPLSAVPTSVMSNTLSMGGLHSFVPTATATAPQEPQPQVQVNNQIGLQHPPRGSALLGNCSPNTGQVANYMRSFLSNLMSPTRSHPPTSVTSSNLYRSVPQESQPLIQSSNNPPVIEDTYSMNRFWNHSSNNPAVLTGRNAPGNSFVKVKTEPRPAPISQMTRVVHDLPSSTQQDRHNRSPRRPSDNVDSESGMDISGDERCSSPLPAFMDTRANARVSTETNQTDNAGVGESSQCSMPFIKIEFPSNSESCNWMPRSSVSHSHFGVQCDIISMSSSHRQSGRTQSETVSSAGGVVDTKCYFCGVTFDDEVLYSIHVGCHSHTDPFLCNVCGKQCHNKYGFYSHIMRGHQSRPNT